MARPRLLIADYGNELLWFLGDDADTRSFHDEEFWESKTELFGEEVGPPGGRNAALNASFSVFLCHAGFSYACVSCVPVYHAC